MVFQFKNFAHMHTYNIRYNLICIVFQAVIQIILDFSVPSFVVVRTMPDVIQSQDFVLANQAGLDNFVQKVGAFYSMGTKVSPFVLSFL